MEQHRAIVLSNELVSLTRYLCLLLQFSFCKGKIPPSKLYMLSGFSLSPRQTALTSGEIQSSTGLPHLVAVAKP